MSVKTSSFVSFKGKKDRFKLDLGDILAEGVDNILADPKIALAEDRVIKMIDGCNHPFNVIENGTELSALFAYDCPYRKTKYYHFVPAWISSKKTEDSKEDGFHRYSLKQAVFLGAPAQMPAWTSAWAGHGYTDFTLPNDGDGEWTLAAVKSRFSGEIVVGYLYVWFNK